MDKTTSIKEMLGEMTPGQLWTIVVAVITVLSTTFGLGMKFGPTLSSNVPAAQSDLVPCSQANGYPLGEWIVSATITNGEQKYVAPFVRFRTPMTGVVQTGEKGAEVGKISLDRPLTANTVNQDITYVAEDNTGYKATLKGVVSGDGCYIKGEWSDSRDHRGSMTLFWSDRSQYWVKR
jgi:hypothetical protein